MKAQHLKAGMKVRLPACPDEGMAEEVVVLDSDAELVVTETTSWVLTYGTVPEEDRSEEDWDGFREIPLSVDQEMEVIN